MPDPVEKSFKEKRQDRQKGRVDKLTAERKTEAKKAGVNLDTPSDIGEPITQRKARLDQAIQKGVTEDMKAGLQKISDLSPTPDIKTPEKPTLDLSIKDVRKKRRAKVADILNSLGQGLAGETVTPSRYRDALKDERLAQYNQYKTTVKGARARGDEWEAGYLEDLLAELNAKKNDPNTTPLQLAQIAKIEQETKLKLAQTKAVESSTNLARQAAKKSKEVKDPTVRVTSKINENVSTSEEMPTAKAHRLQKYNNELSSLNDKVAEAQDNLDAIGNTGTGITNKANRKIRADLEAALTAAKEARQAFSDNYETYINTETATQPAAEQGNQEAATETPMPGEIDIWNL